MNILEVKNIDWVLEDEKILDDIDFNLEEGQSTIISGTYESGKSLLLKVIGGITPPSHGRVLFLGRDVYESPDDTIDEIHQQIAFIFQEGALLSNLNIRENLLLPLKYHNPRLNLPEITREIEEYMAFFNLGHILDKRPAALPNVKKKLLSFVRAAILHPRLMIVDEPLFNLDLDNQKLVLKLLKKLRKSGISMLIVSNSRDLIKILGDRWLVMDRGRIVQDVSSSDADFDKKLHTISLTDLVGVEDEI